MITYLANQLAKDGHKVAVLAASEKLVDQNYDKAPDKSICGVYCAGLGREELDKQITYATIQSIANRVINPTIVIVDECEAIHPDEESNTQYRHFLRINGSPAIVGFTATPWRSKGGSIDWGEKLYDIPLQPLIDNGFVIPPTSKAGKAPDLTNIRITAGEFNGKQMDEVYADPDLLKASIEYILSYGADRNRLLVFSQSVQHGKILTENLNANGMPSIFIDGTTPKSDLRKIFELHEQGIYKAVVNCMLCTVGYDLPWVDMVAIIRSTNSKRLFEQMAWRPGTPYPNKQSFTLLDMGGNLERHGPLGSPYKEKGAREKAAESLGKICPSCEEYVKPLTMQCPDCGYEWPESERPKINHDNAPNDSTPAIYTPSDKRTFDVTSMRFVGGKTKKGDDCIIASFFVRDYQWPSIKKWIMPHHDSDFARGQAHSFFKKLGDDIYGDLKHYPIVDLVWRAEHNLKTPARIYVDLSKDFPDIISYEFDDYNEVEPPIDTEEFLDDCIMF